MKIGNIELGEWELDEPRIVRKQNIISDGYGILTYPTVGISVSRFIGEVDALELIMKFCYIIEFYGNLYFLAPLYDGPASFGSCEEAMTYADNFLARMDKLQAFW
jgi:hypothetical protein